MTQNGEKVVGHDTTVGEVLKKVMQDKAYYKRTGGGLTLSGGESLCQQEFVTALLTEAKAQGISTAVETTACLPYYMIEPQLPLLDYVLMDIKHTNSKKHEIYTGMRNELILDNAKKIAKAKGDRLIIRVPVIPGFNDTDSEVRDIAHFAASLDGVRQIHLLPYHRLGYDKYIGLLREYGMGDIRPPQNEQMEKLRRIAEAEGLKAIIGG